ncbi:MAG: DUF1127 domain-containing protein [Hyphomicrobiaceae bacterium]
MAQTQTFDGCVTDTVAGPTTGLFAGYAAQFRKWRSRQAAIAQLHGMEDRQLQDIGISRSEIDSVVYLAGRDPTRLRRG